MRLLVIAAAACGVAALVPGAHAQDAADLRRGEVLMLRYCAECHAIGRRGASAQKEAPPFRMLGRRYAIESLEEALGEGILAGHPEMPEFKFSPADVGAVVAYLKSIQER